MATERDSLLLRGVLDLCVLALMEHEPVYGYEVASRLGELGLPVAAGSVYPLLARMERGGLITAQSQPSSAGPPRRVWSLRPAGVATLTSGRGTWLEMSRAITTALDPSKEKGSRR